MSPPLRPDPKARALRQARVLNPRPQRVDDPLFSEHDFFDPRDLVQVKYEMVRRVCVEGQSIRQAARAFGFSRPSFYAAKALLDQKGLEGLIPRRRGPRHSHKLTTEVMGFVRKLLEEDPSLRARVLVERIAARWGLRVHPRTVERALARSQKKRR